jgi:hypothetical protein
VTSGRFLASGTTSVSATGVAAVGVVFVGAAGAAGAADGSAGTVTVMLCVVAVVDAVVAGVEPAAGVAGVDAVAVGSVTTGAEGVAGTVVPGSLAAGSGAAGSAVGGAEPAEESVVVAGPVPDGAGVAAGSVPDGAGVAVGSEAVASVAAGADGSVVVAVEPVVVDVESVAVESAVPEPVEGSEAVVVVDPEPLSAAAGCANVTAKPARQATSTMTRSRVKRSESTPTSPLPITPTSPYCIRALRLATCTLLLHPAS